MLFVVVVVVIVVVVHRCTLVMAMLIVLTTNLWNTPGCIFVDVRVWVWGSVDVGTSMGIHYPSRRFGMIEARWERTAHY